MDTGNNTTEQYPMTGNPALMNMAYPQMYPNMGGGMALTAPGQMPQRNGGISIGGPSAGTGVTATPGGYTGGTGTGGTAIPNTQQATGNYPWIGQLSTTNNSYPWGLGSNVSSGYLNYLQPNIQNALSSYLTQTLNPNQFFQGANMSTPYDQILSLLGGNAAGGYVSNATQQMASQGGLSNEYVQSMRDMVLKPQQQALEGRLNAMGGGIAAPSSGLMQYLQQQNEQQFNNQLVGQGMNNYMNALGLGNTVQQQTSQQYQNLLGQLMNGQLQNSQLGLNFMQSQMNPYTQLANTGLSGDIGLEQEKYRSEALAEMMKSQMIGGGISDLLTAILGKIGSGNQTNSPIFNVYGGQGGVGGTGGAGGTSGSTSSAGGGGTTAIPVPVPGQSTNTNTINNVPYPVQTGGSQPQYNEQISTNINYDPYLPVPSEMYQPTDWSPEMQDYYGALNQYQPPVPDYNIPIDPGEILPPPNQGFAVGEPNPYGEPYDPFATASQTPTGGDQSGLNELMAIMGGGGETFYNPNASTDLAQLIYSNPLLYSILSGNQGNLEGYMG